VLAMRTKLIILFIATILAQQAFTQSLKWNKKANPANNTINSIAFSSNGNQVLSGTNCHPASIRIFNATNGNLDWDFTVGSNFLFIMGVAFSSNSKYLAAIEEFGNIFIFDNSGNTPVFVDTIQTGTSYGFATAISPDNTQVAVACSNGKLKTYKLSDGTLLQDINAHTNWVTTLAFSQDGSKIITGSDDDKIKIWDLNGNLLFTCLGHTNSITQVKVTPNNQWLVSSSKDNKIKIWDVNNGTLVRTITGHIDDVNGIDISPDGTKIVSGSVDKTCKIWDIYSGKLLSTFSIQDSGSVTAVAWSPKGNEIASGNAISDLMYWHVPAVLGLENLPKTDFNISIFPNPTTDILQITGAQKLDIKTIEIIDQQGRIVYRTNNNISTVLVSNLKNGLYTLFIETNNNLKSYSKFIKN
jgi:WD40 repeat protein